MSSQEIKLGRPSINNHGNHGELRIGRIAPAAKAEQGPWRTAPVTKVPGRTSTVNKTPEHQVNKRGYSIGVNARPEAEQAAGAPGKNSQSVRPVTLIMLCCALVFLIVVSLSASGKRSRVRTGGPAFMNSYAAYLANHKESQEANIKQRLADVEYRLQKVTVAEGTGDYQKARADLYELMLLDRDAQSPLYKHCSAWLQRLPK